MQVSYLCQNQQTLSLLSMLSVNLFSEIHITAETARCESRDLEMNGSTGRLSNNFDTLSRQKPNLQTPLLAGTTVANRAVCRTLCSEV